MKIRRYTCKDMQEALLKVKIDLGSEAVIMSSRKVKPKGFLGLFKKPLIEVVAAIDDEYVRPGRTNYSQRHVSAYDTRPQPAPEKYVPSPGPTSESSPAKNEEYMKTTAGEAKTIAFENPGQIKENSKISELEDKVKNLESMLHKIYQVVQSDKAAETTQEDVGAAEETENNAAVNEAIHEETKIAEDKKEDDKDFTTLKGKSLFELRNILFENDVEPKLIEKILEKIIEHGGHDLKREGSISSCFKGTDSFIG